MLLVEGSSETGFFRQVSNNVFWSPYSQKYISYEGYLFFENTPNLIQIPKMEKNFEKKISVSAIIPYELIALNILY